jgi:hypothetical protein
LPAAAGATEASSAGAKSQPGREFRYREADAGEPLLIPPAAGP